MLYKALELPRKTYGSALFHHLKIFRDLDLTRCRLLAACPFADTNGQGFEEVRLMRPTFLYRASKRPNDYLIALKRTREGWTSSRPQHVEWILKTASG